MDGSSGRLWWASSELWSFEVEGWLAGRLVGWLAGRGWPMEIGDSDSEFGSLSQRPRCCISKRCSSFGLRLWRILIPILASLPLADRREEALAERSGMRWKSCGRRNLPPELAFQSLLRMDLGGSRGVWRGLAAERTPAAELSAAWGKARRGFGGWPARAGPGRVELESAEFVLRIIIESMPSELWSSG